MKTSRGENERAARHACAVRVSELTVSMVLRSGVVTGDFLPGIRADMRVSMRIGAAGGGLKVQYTCVRGEYHAYPQVSASGYWGIRVEWLIAWSVSAPGRPPVFPAGPLFSGLHIRRQSFIFGSAFLDMLGRSGVRVGPAAAAERVVFGPASFWSVAGDFGGSAVGV